MKPSTESREHWSKFFGRDDIEGVVGIATHIVAKQEDPHFLVHNLAGAVVRFSEALERIASNQLGGPATDIARRALMKDEGV